MERRCIYRTRAREHNNTMQKLTLNYTHLQEHTHLLIHVHEHVYIRCIRTRIYIEDMRTKKVNECAVTSGRIVFLVKTANSNVMPTLRGFR